MSAATAQAVFAGRSATRRARPARRGGTGIAILFAALVSTNLATLGALYFAPEIQTLLSNDRSTLYTAYERRIVELRLEVDRLYSRQYAQAGDLNLQLHELTQQQDVLAEQQQVVRMLADQARALGIAPDETALLAPIHATTGALPVSGPDAVGALGEWIYTMQGEARLALAALSDAASESTGEIVSGLSRLGLAPAMSETAMGGPFLPAEGTSGTGSLSGEANAVAAALARYAQARDAMAGAPIRQPVAGAPQTTSNYGNRTDPFLGRPAFHSGMDFRAATGTPVLSAADGVVRSAGRNGGYGNVVEIDHGNGLATRYAHLSAISVAAGNTISAGQQIGLAGSTGRSTGPHLHYEVRRGDSPVNPVHYLEVGRALAAYL